VRETFGKPLARIFTFYLEQAEQRRSQSIAAEKARLKELRALTSADTATLAASKAASMAGLLERAQASKLLISHKEYARFCGDFSLKSTSLLTAVQTGEIFLNLASPSSGSSAELGLSLELFYRALVYMALVAYRDAQDVITPERKVKSLLLYMWKAVNDSAKTQRLVRSNRAHTLTHFAGSLDLFNSGQFSDAFLQAWIKDGFRDYASPDQEAAVASGTAMVRQLVQGESAQGSKGAELVLAAGTGAAGIGEEAEDDHALLGNLQKHFFMDTAEPAQVSSSKPRRTNSIYIQPFARTIQARAATSDHTAALYAGSKGASRGISKVGRVYTLEGSKLALLLLHRPELAEFLFMEVESMKQLQPRAHGTAP
jgi:hypothetical protein